MDIDPLVEAWQCLSAARRALGDGDCPAQKCPGCRIDTQEARDQIDKVMSLLEQAAPHKDFARFPW